MENAIEHAVVRARGTVVVPRDFPPEVRGTAPERENGLGQRANVEAALQAAGGRIGRAAEILGIEPGAPVLVLHRETYTTNNRIIEFRVSKGRADKFSYKTEIR